MRKVGGSTFSGLSLVSKVGVWCGVSVGEWEDTFLDDLLGFSFSLRSGVSRGGLVRVGWERTSRRVWMPLEFWAD